ncbi:Double-stranded RNA-specific editase 1 [Scomber scombrus]|uniref:Double-stranded RNA-specific editase 1 n=1 Tax=Scomber scombrus TaxID=13677 RepID=A0AAV1P2C3_SCOSC
MRVGKSNTERTATAPHHLAAIMPHFCFTNHDKTSNRRSRPTADCGYCSTCDRTTDLSPCSAFFLPPSFNTSDDTEQNRRLCFEVKCYTEALQPNLNFPSPAR